MLVSAYRHDRLMRESESRVGLTANSQSPADVIVSRILMQPDAYRHWEAEHDRLMRAVSEQVRLAHQVTALRSTAFALVHRRALFEYLRDRHITGWKRRRLFALFYGCRDYTNAVLAEHANYVRSSSSYLCAHHLGAHLMHDAAFNEPLQVYEQWYRDYFRAFCDGELAGTDEEREAMLPLNALRPLLKSRLGDAREAILAMPRTCEKDWHELQIRRPNGEIRRLRAIFGAD